jgi:hypothetical protein
MTTTEPIEPSADVSAVAPADAGLKARRRPVRTVFAALVGIIAILGLLTSVIALWAKDTLFDSASVAAAVDNAMQQPEVTDAMAVYLTDQILVAVDAQDFVAGVLPAQLGPLAPALVGGVRSFVSDRLEKLLATDEVRNVLTTLVEHTHAALMRLLRGDGGIAGVTIDEGEVSVNLLPLLSRGLLRVQDLGVLDNVSVPTLSADGDPADQLAQLESALGRDLPENFGQLTVYRSDRLAKAQESVKRAQETLVLARRALALVLIITGLAFAGCIALSVRRARATLVLLLASAAAMVIVRVVVRRVVADVPGLALQPGAQVAIRSTLSTLTSGLLTAAGLVGLIGVGTAIAIYLSGESSLAVSLRARMGSSGAGARGVVAAHGDAVAIAAFAAAVLVLFVGGIGWGSLIVALVFAVAGGWALIQRTDEVVLPPS